MEWISVEDRLPESDKKVLSYGVYGYVVAEIESGHWQAQDTDYETGEPWLYDDGAVTHWMPLPDPPTK